MKTILNDTNNEIVIKNSRFITKLIKINSSNIDSYLNDVRIEYPKATHYTYAFIYNDVKHSSDDGEPGGTAGMPILNVLEKENLNNVLCIVIRYFGGIKLGAGGLIRAYTKSVTECLKNTLLTDLISGFKININFNYEDEKDVNYILKDSIIVNREYNDNVCYTCLIDIDTYNKLHKFDVLILDNVYIEKLN